MKQKMKVKIWSSKLIVCKANKINKPKRKREGFPGGSVIKNLSAMQEPQETQVRSLGQEDPPEKGIATHSSILAWRIPWTEEPGRLQSVGCKESDMTEAS